MKINILDAGIRHLAGHHYDYGLKLVRELVAAGHDVHVYGASLMDDDVAANFRALAPISRHFTIWPHALPEKYDFYAGSFVRHRVEPPVIARDLREVRSADLWIFPTIWTQEIAACALLRVDVPVVGCVYWDPGIEWKSDDARFLRSALLLAHSAKVDITLTSVEPEMRNRFLPIIPNGKFVTIPQPADGPPLPQAKKKLKRIGFFGHQRLEKGTSMLQRLVPQLVKDGYSITYQDSFTKVELPDLPGIKCLRHVHDIAEPIAECDLVVLPYDVDPYRARGSGIVVECLALGVPVTAPAGTLPGRTIELHGVGPLFSIPRAPPVYNAIKIADANFARFAKKAHQAAVHFAAHNGSARFAKALLAAAK
jgi:glycosyltransferase involved in cell wall biosynthesis